MSAWRFPIIPALPPGTRSHGHVDWRDPLLTGWEWPLVAVNGARPGPALLVTAGVHGSEYTSIDAAIRFAAALDPASLAGSVLCLPLVNPPAFAGRTAYVCPVDGLNPNRVFPGRAEGSFTERLAFRLAEGAIRHADAFVDLHGGDLPEALVPFTIHEHGHDPSLDARTAALARAFGQPIHLATRAATTPIGGTTISAGARAGVPSILVEDGGCGVCDEAASARLRDGLERVLRHLSMAAGAALPAPAAPRVFERFTWLRTERAGFFRPAIRVGDAIEAGTSIGTVGDFFGAVVEEIRSPVAGILLFLVVSAAMGANGLVCGIAASDEK